MEEIIYQQAWTQTFAGECLKLDSSLGEIILEAAADVAHQVAYEAVQRFDYGKMQDALAAKRKTIDTLMGEGEGG